MSPKSTKTWLIIFNIIFGLGLIPAVIMSLMSVMMFDSPGSENSYTTWCLFWSVISLPIFIVISIPAGWIFYKKEKYSYAIVAGLLPCLSILLIATAFGMISFFCGGQFNCE
jgi:hypothetical protein